MVRQKAPDQRRGYESGRSPDGWRRGKIQRRQTSVFAMGLADQGPQDAGASQAVGPIYCEEEEVRVCPGLLKRVFLRTSIF